MEAISPVNKEKPLRLPAPAESGSKLTGGLKTWWHIPPACIWNGPGYKLVDLEPWIMYMMNQTSERVSQRIDRLWVDCRYMGLQGDLGLVVVDLKNFMHAYYAPFRQRIAGVGHRSVYFFYMTCSTYHMCWLILMRYPGSYRHSTPGYIIVYLVDAWVRGLDLG